MSAHRHVNKDYVFHELTRALCPECLQVVDAKVILRDGKVYLVKWCREHGTSEALVYGDAEAYVRAERYNRPGRLPEHYTSKRDKGCPHDCGICPDHEQHMCVGLLDVTDNCNMACPTCFAGSRGRSFLRLDQVTAALDGYIRQEGDPTVVQISGGEPTQHPQIIEILRLAGERPFSMIILNTNGLRLARDEAFVERLAEMKDRIEIYLQFDSLRPEATKAIRGKDYTQEKLRAVENCATAGLPMHLACTVVKGINDGDLGDLVDFGVRTDMVRGVNFQPAFWCGRYEHPMDPLDRMTVPDVTKALEAQTGGQFRQSDFVPLPCSNPACINMTYAWIKKGKVKPIPRFVDFDRYMNYLTNTIFFYPMPAYREALQNLFSLSNVMSSAQTLKDFGCVCGAPFKKAFFSEDGRRQLQNQKLFRILIIQFEDRHTFDLKRVKKCCIGHVIPDGRIIPFCSYNTLYRQEYDVSRWVEPGLPATGNIDVGARA